MYSYEYSYFVVLLFFSSSVLFGINWDIKDWELANFTDKKLMQTRTQMKLTITNLLLFVLNLLLETPSLLSYLLLHNIVSLYDFTNYY